MKLYKQFQAFGMYFFVCVNDNPIVDAMNLQLMCCIMCYNNRVGPNNTIKERV
jgi:hypothetical protein